MKYFFVHDKHGNHIYIAKDEISAREMTGVTTDTEDAYLYELAEVTFKEEGWLMTAK